MTSADIYILFILWCLFVFLTIDKIMAILSYIKIMPIIFVIYLANIFWPKTTMKNLNVKFVVSFFLCLGSAFTNKVAKVEVMTSNCEDCGMGPFGSLSIRVLTYLNGSNHLKSLRIKKKTSEFLDLWRIWRLPLW